MDWGQRWVIGYLKPQFPFPFPFFSKILNELQIPFPFGSVFQKWIAIPITFSIRESITISILFYLYLFNKIT